jgi:hypothetical protein
MFLHSHPAQSHLWWCRVPLKATFGGVAFPKGEVLLNPYRSKKIEKEIRHRDG